MASHNPVPFDAGADGATRHPTTTSEKIRFSIALMCSIGGQTLQNIAVPMFLSRTTDDVGVMLCYTTLVYMIFFHLLDLFLSLLSKRSTQLALDMNHKAMAWVGFENAMAGVGILFGGSQSRTPLPLQMTFFLFTNQLAPVYKVLRRFGFRRPAWKAVLAGLGKRGLLMLGGATVLFLTAMLLVLSDNLSHSTEHPMSPYCLFFIFGTMASMTYNVDQDAVMADTRTIELLSGEPLGHDRLTFMQHFRRDVATLRYQTTWLFVFAWLGPVVSLAGGSEGGALTHDLFLSSWANLLPFTNTWINVLNVAYIVTFFGNIYVNRFDSAFTMITNNVSAVSAMWTGWVPRMMPDTVGFVPSYAKTIPAMVFSLVAIFPSWEFSKAFRSGLQSGDDAVEAENIVSVNHYLLGDNGGKL